MTGTLADERRNAENVDMAFSMIRSAAMMLMAFPYAKAAKSLRQQEDVAWFLDPTLMNAPGARDDLARKLRLLDAAARFVEEFEAVRSEALGEGE